MHIMLCLISVPVWRMSLNCKIGLYFCMVLFSVGQHLSLWPTIKTLSVVGISNKFSDVNHLFRSFDFRDFLEKHLHFFIRAFQNIVKMLLDNIRLYFISKSSHTVI